MKQFLRILLFAFLSLAVTVNAHAAQRKIYLVNGFLSAALGYGLRNLSKKISGERYFEFVGGIPASTKNGIISDAARAYKKDPGTKIALVGISAGANAVTQIAAELGRLGVPVHYLGAIEGGSMTPIRSNVRLVDSFVCNGGTCSSNLAPRAAGNSQTRFRVIKLRSSHIGSADDPALHSRVISQINAM